MDAAPAPSAKNAEKKAKPADLVIPPKQPKLSKAERRALQEAQRASKAAGGGEGGGKLAGGRGVGDIGGAGIESGASPGPSGVGDGPTKGIRGKSVNEEEKKEAVGGDERDSRGSGSGEDKMVSLFSHLPRPKAPSEIHHHLASVS